MTGFGAAIGPVGTARVAVELRSVNHRFFNPSIKLPASLAQWEGDVRAMLRARIARGHVSLSARIERQAPVGATIDEARFAGYVEQLRVLQERHALHGPVDATALLRLPDVIAANGGDDVGGSVQELEIVVQQALDALIAMREAEGERLRTVLSERMATIERLVDSLAARAPERLVAERDRLSRSVRELASGIELDEGRVAQEIALLADRLDVSEELDRFGAHIAAFRAALARPPREPVGKRLGFLLQEMLREANTTGSKARDAAMLHDVVAVKEELERVAEQVENVE
ncbi:MAG TPA: YicC/YloC family endoribonuclease [Gemmatimonadaceae bacterium]|nr:YicC/YloC family endoribonuclease [Gemmatimonadaceae bacterium]